MAHHDDGAPGPTTAPSDVAAPWPAWWLGWRPLVAIGTTFYVGFALGNAVAIPGSFVLRGDGLLTMALLSTVGLLVGAGLWYAGVRAVNAGVDDVLEAARATLRRAVTDTTGADLAYVELVHGTGTKPLVRGHAAYTVTGFGFAPGTLVVGAVEVDAVAPAIDSPTVTALAPDDVATVTVDDSVVQVALTDGRTATYRADVDPADLLDAFDRWTDAEVRR